MKITNTSKTAKQMKKIGIFSTVTGKRKCTFTHQTEAAKWLGVNISNVCRTLNGKHSSCKNYTIKYI